MQFTIPRDKAQAQKAYEDLNARMFPPHHDVENAISYAYQKLQIFTREKLVEAMEHGDVRWIDQVAHAADRLVTAIEMMEGEMERPVKARFVPEALP